MTDRLLSMNKNALVAYLNKSAAEFTIDDIVRYIAENGIQMVNFMYPAGDGRLKTLNFVINSEDYLRTILTLGERVDGSSLFPFVSASGSDLYVVPRLRTAFVDPFAPMPTLTFLCSYFDKDGKPFGGAPEQTLRRACNKFTEQTGLRFQAMGELEFYVVMDDSGVFPAADQRGYHESGPFSRSMDFRMECMLHIASTGAQIKYGHSEVGNFRLDGKIYEQCEIEFLPVDACDAADQLVLAKWIIRKVADEYGYDLTFAPKITAGKAGSGLHVHMRLVDKDGRSVMTDGNGRLSDEARRAIAGLMMLAPAITALGNTNPTSYFRLVPHQEAPTNVCWGDRNRSVLVRVPLGWTSGTNMFAQANPGVEADLTVDPRQKQTIEIRSADCSADVYQLMAGLAVAVRYGFELENALDIARDKYVDVNIHDAANAGRLASLDSLPTDCASSADAFESRRDVFEAGGVFSPAAIDGILKALRSFDPAEAEAAKNDPEAMLRLVRRHFHCG